jgi:ADP-ribosyl-[dinitrogen reductase] hydrolase
MGRILERINIPEKGVKITVISKLERATGVLVGQFCGDAFGAQYEFGRARKEISEKMGSSRVWNTAAGQLTDDSEMAVELIASIISKGRYDVTAAENNYKRWYGSIPFDIGMTTAQALGGGNKNIDSKANGALMRVSPLGIFYATHGDEKRCAESAKADAAITHPNPVCREVNAIFTCAIAKAISEGLDPLGIYSYMLDKAKKCSEIDIYDAVKEAQDRVPADITGKSGYVLLALHNAAYRLLNSESVKDAIIETVKMGGDTDTNACIAGALVGACRGTKSVPADWIKTVQNCDTNRGRHPRAYQRQVRDIKELAKKLLAL